MSKKTLFLAWQDKDRSRQWFPVGQLDADVDLPYYRFRYTNGAVRAKEDANFPLLLEFPELEGDYQSPELFPTFRNRVIMPGRPDFAEYLRSLNLPKTANPVEIMSVDGGYRATDTYEVFPKIEKHADGKFSCRFFLHGWRHVSASAQKRVYSLEVGENLYITLELTNPATKWAVQIQTTDYQMVGWAPRYLVPDLALAMVESFGEYQATVVKVNPLPAPSKQRVLIEMRGFWDKHEPMTSDVFQPIVT